jgi:hypothetical protein
VLGSVSTDPTYTWLTQGGSVGILALAVISFMRGWIVPGGTLKQTQQECRESFQRVREERDRALEQVYKLAEISQRAVEAAERKVAP